ncbi:MAG: chorismate synthase [Deltaproteobacteria bacterium]|nr:chorismate synthase [Deltaproteobacteria bacterium]
MTSTFGQLYRITTFGESHGGGVGVVIDGCPPGIPVSVDEVGRFLARRRPGQSSMTSSRQEEDVPECLSGLEDGLTLGTPLMLMVRNRDIKRSDYNDLRDVYRPSHADFTTEAKFGLRSSSGGGRASARETIGRVAGAAVAEQLLRFLIPELKVLAWVDSVGEVSASPQNPDLLTREMLDGSLLRCPDPVARIRMEELILDAKRKGDTVGGCIRGACLGVPPGLGEPVFDKLEADLAKGMMSLPAARAFEIGSGFQAALMKGSEHNDPFCFVDGRIRTVTNHSGGIQGGISNGEAILFRVAFKAVSTLFIRQDTVNKKGESRALLPEGGRHDPCVLPRAVPIVEAMALLVLTDHLLRQMVMKGARRRDVGF